MPNGSYITDNGYVKIIKPKNHPSKGRYIFLHRLIIENKLGRYLSPIERVHHIDGNKLNNAPENLGLYANQSEHAKAGVINGRKYKKLWENGWLKKEYEIKKRTLTSIGNELGCKEGTVRFALNRQGIKRRRYTLTEASLEARYKGALAKKARKFV